MYLAQTHPLLAGWLVVGGLSLSLSSRMLIKLVMVLARRRRRRQWWWWWWWRGWRAEDRGGGDVLVDVQVAVEVEVMSSSGTGE